LFPLFSPFSTIPSPDLQRLWLDGCRLRRCTNLDRRKKKPSNDFQHNPGGSFRHIGSKTFFNAPYYGIPITTSCYKNAVISSKAFERENGAPIMCLSCGSEEIGDRSPPPSECGIVGGAANCKNYRNNIRVVAIISSIADFEKAD
jgi:hypothetical protein